jgi:hypothetical protein
MIIDGMTFFQTQLNIRDPNPNFKILEEKIKIIANFDLV